MSQLIWSLRVTVIVAKNAESLYQKRKIEIFTQLNFGPLYIYLLVTASCRS